MRTIIFMGVGALGSTTAILCRNLPVILRVVDFDHVEAKNLKAQGFVKQSLGQSKVVALKSQFFSFWGIKTENLGVRVTEANVLALCTTPELPVVVDCFDNAASRQILIDHCTAYKLPLVHAGMSGDGKVGMVRWSPRFTPDSEGAPGTPTCEGGEHLPFIGQLSGVLACAIQAFLHDGTQRDSLVTPSSVRTIFEKGA